MAKAGKTTLMKLLCTEWSFHAKIPWFHSRTMVLEVKGLNWAFLHIVSHHKMARLQPHIL